MQVSRHSAVVYGHTLSEIRIVCEPYFELSEIRIDYKLFLSEVVKWLGQNFFNKVCDMIKNIIFR